MGNLATASAVSRVPIAGAGMASQDGDTASHDLMATISALISSRPDDGATDGKEY